MYLNTLTYYNKMNFTVFLFPIIQITQLLNPVILSDIIFRISNTTYALTEYMNNEATIILNKIHYPIMNDDIYDDDIYDDDIFDKITKGDSDEWMI
tara:strand:- start:2617 stop:2904 length:288 start_codon:yes stop_codon:yes gene_type:complete